MERKKGSSLTKIESKPLLYASFVDVFISPKFELVSALSTIVVSKEIGLQIAEALLNIFEIYSDQTAELMKWAVSHEIEQATTTTTLFRGASFSARMMNAFYQKVGASYLKNILGPWLAEITTKNVSYEVDPAKALPTDNVEENQKKLQEMAEKLLDGILSSVEQCPVPIRQLLSHAKEKVSQKFPDMGHSVIGGSIFLRFICPAIVAPGESGLLLTDTLGSETRRALVLISKLLQNLANELLFEMKESYMLPFNPFLTANIPRIREFLSQVTAPPRRDSNPIPKFFTLPNEEVLTENINVLHQTVTDHREKIGKYIEKAYPSNFASLFLSRLDDALSSTANLKKKRLSFFGRPKGKTTSHGFGGDEDFRSLPRKALHDLGLGSGSDRDSDKETQSSPTTSPIIAHENRRSHSNTDPESVERLFKNQVDMFITFFGSKLKEKDRQLQEALDIAPTVPKVPRSQSETAVDTSSEVVRLRVENAELMKQVKAMHEENSKLRDMVRRHTAETNGTDQLQQMTFDLVARLRADVDRMATLLSDQEDHKQRKRASRESKRLQKSSSKEGMDERKHDRHSKHEKSEKHENHKKHENHVQHEESNDDSDEGIKKKEKESDKQNGSDAPCDNEKEVDDKKGKVHDVKDDRKLEKKLSGSAHLDALLSKVSSEQQARFVELFEMELI